MTRAESVRMRIGKRLIALALAATASASAGCYKATFLEPQTIAGERHDEWSSFFLWGLVGEEEIDVRTFCRSGEVAMVRTGANAGTAMVSLVTLGIYMPRKVYVTCAAPRASARATEVPQ